MPQDNPIGILTGLAFVGIFLVMIASCGGVAKLVQAPAAPGYELTGSSTPVQ